MSEKNKNPFRRLASSLRDMQDRHRDRHRPSGFGFAFADRIDYMYPQHWDAVTNSGTIFLRPDVLRVIENHGPENIEPRYALVFRGDKPVAALVTQLVSVTREQFKKGQHVLERIPGFTPLRGEADSTDRLTRSARESAGDGDVRRRTPGRWSDRMLVAGNLLSWGFHGIAFASDEKPKELWPGVADALYRIRRAARLSGETNFVMLKDVTPEQSGLESLRRFSYRPMETEPNMVLEIDPAWRTYEDYLSALDAKYRRNAKDQLKKLASAGCRMERLEDLAPHAPRLHDLYLSVQGNASIRLVTLQEGYLAALSRVAGADFRCTAVRRREEILGFVTTLRDGDSAIGYYIGFDRAAQTNGLPLYLRLLHTTIGDAIDWRCKRLSLGRTALEPKAGLGAKPEPMCVWMRHRVPALNWMLRGLLGAVPHAEAPERSPFKNVQKAQAECDCP